MEGLQNVGMEETDGMINVSSEQVAMCFEILEYSVLQRSFNALYDYIFQKVAIAMMDLAPGPKGRLVRLPSTSVQSSINDRYWTPWARVVAMWLLTVGVCPYYTVSLGEIIGKAPSSSLEATAVWGQRVPFVPSWREGSIRTGRKGQRYTGPQIFQWVWKDGSPAGEDSHTGMRWITSPTNLPCPVTGQLNSALSSLIPEWKHLLQMAWRLDVVEDLRAMPPLFIRQEQMTPTTYQDRYNGPGQGTVGMGGGSHMADALTPYGVDIAYQSAYSRQYQSQQIQEDSLRRAAEAVYERMHAVERAFRKADGHEDADEAWAYHRERRILLPVGCHMDKGPDVGGLTREQWDNAVLRFEQHATSLIGFPSEMWGQSGSSKPMNPVHARVGFDISSVLEHAVASRKAQFTEIIQSAFIHANRYLWEEDFRRMRVRLPVSHKPIWPELWGRILIRVELGPSPSATLEELVFARDQGIIDDPTMRRLGRYMIGVEEVEEGGWDEGAWGGGGDGGGGSSNANDDGEEEEYEDARPAKEKKAVGNPPLVAKGEPSRKRNRKKVPGSKPAPDKEQLFKLAKLPVLPKASSKKKARGG